MESARWTSVEEQFHRLADRPHAEQVEALRALEQTDATLAADVRAMLDADGAGASLLDRTLGTVVHDILTTDDTLPTIAFGPYRITGLLGEGGMGVVYLGTRDDLGAKAAIKVLREAWLAPSRRERFVQEQRTLASLEHPGIARLLDADRLPDGTPWFAMEYVEGVPITEYCRAQRSTLRERLALFRQACEAVRFAHERGVIHRDIKPGNMLVSTDGTVKLLDFGIAKSTSALADGADPTRTQFRMLTPAYAAPEQLRGEVVGVQADVFALGVLLFELLSGVRPYDTSGLPPADAARFIEETDTVRVSVAWRARGAGTDREGTDAVALDALRRSARDDLDALVGCAAHADRTRRYRSVDALLLDLQRYDRTEPLAAQPDSMRYRIRKFTARRWREATLAVLLIGTGTIGALSYTVGLRRARAAAEAETERVSALRDVLVSLFDGGDPEAGPSNALRVSDLIENGIREGRQRSSDARLQADLFGVLGNASAQLGKPAIADTLLEQSWRMKERLYGVESHEALMAAVEWARHQFERGETDTALTSMRRAHAVVTTQFTAKDPLRAEVTRTLGTMLAKNDEIDEGIPLLEEALRLQGGIDSMSIDFANARSALADGHYYGQHFPTSDTLNLLVIAQLERLLGPDHPSAANNYVNLGESAGRDGRYADAERYNRKALAIVERYFGPEHYRTAAALKNVGKAMSYQDRDAEALPLLRRALAIQERVLDSSSAPIAGTLNTIATAESNLGNMSVAIDLLHRAARIYTRLYGEAHSATLVARANIASMYLNESRADSAATIFADVVRLGSGSLGPDHQDVAIFRIKLGRTRLRQRRYEDAIASSLAGLRSLEKTSSQPTSFSRAARKDIRAAYLALGDTRRAAVFADPDARLDAQSDPPAAIR